MGRRREPLCPSQLATCYGMVGVYFEYTGAQSEGMRGYWAYAAHNLSHCIFCVLLNVRCSTASSVLNDVNEGNCNTECRDRDDLLSLQDYFVARNTWYVEISIGICALHQWCDLSLSRSKYRGCTKQAAGPEKGLLTMPGAWQCHPRAPPGVCECWIPCPAAPAGTLRQPATASSPLPASLLLPAPMEPSLQSMP